MVSGVQCHDDGRRRDVKAVQACAADIQLLCVHAKELPDLHGSRARADDGSMKVDVGTVLLSDPRSRPLRTVVRPLAEDRAVLEVELEENPFGFGEGVGRDEQVRVHVVARRLVVQVPRDAWPTKEDGVDPRSSKGLDDLGCDHIHVKGPRCSQQALRNRAAGTTAHAATVGESLRGSEPE
jgi:hypothetical protein